MKNRKVITLLVVIVLLVSTGFIYEKLQHKKITEDNDLKSKVETLAESKNGYNEKNIVKFKKITTFNWDKLYIIEPYVNLQEYAKEYNIEGISSINTDIDINDSINLLVFVLNKKVVAYINYPRNKGDFYNSNKHGQNEFTPDEAIFQVKEENNCVKMTNVK